VSIAIGIICKAPQPGRSKTRLGASIGAQAAAELSACFLRDLAATIESVPHTQGRRGVAVYAPAEGEALLRSLLPPTFDLLLQTGRDLGEVLLGATRALLESGHRGVLLVNGDSPTLPSRLLVQAIEALQQDDDRMVLGPASDGGYYLIGLKRPHARVFARVNWGTASVLAETRSRADEIGLPVVLLPEWYDVDDEETLRCLQEELAGRSVRFADGAHATRTRAYLAASPELVR
jgi:rSAM/selenodomain-associated transferase 1